MGVTNILGLHETASTITNFLQSNSCSTLLIKGPSGRGKSWVVESIASGQKAGNWCFLFLYGDENNTNSFYPLTQFIEKKERNFNTKRKVINETAGQIPYVGRGIKAILDEYDFRKIKFRKKIQDIIPFKEHISFSMHLAGLNKKYNRIVIICENIDLFDDQTVQFLSELKSGYKTLNECFTISFLLITDDTSFSLDHTAFDFNDSKEIILPALTIDQIKQLMTIWTSQVVDQTTLELIASCTGGHLKLLKMVAYHLKLNPTETLAQNFLYEIVDSRLKSLKVKYEAIKELFSMIDNAGNNISKYELYCLLGDTDECNDLIEKAASFELILQQDNYIKFVHPDLKKIVSSYTPPHKSSYYKNLAICLKKLSPKDYVRRAQNEILCNRVDQSDVYWTLASIQKMREGNLLNAQYLLYRISESKLSLREVCSQFLDAYRYSLNGKSEQAIDILHRMPNTLPDVIHAEKDYLHCENLLKRISNQSKLEALEIISRWEDFDNEEPEIWSRIMQLRIVVTSELGQLSAAREIESRILRYNAARIMFDSNAKYVLERLALFSDVLYSPEIAHKKMRQTEFQVTQEYNLENFHRGLEVYIFRTNLSGNSFLLGRMSDCIAYAEGALRILEQLNNCNFPYTEAALSNLLLAAYFSVQIDIELATSRYKSIYLTSELEENRLLIDINFAGLILLDKGPKNALQILEQSVPPIKEHDDPYYFYYYWSNCAFLQYLNNNTERAKEILDVLRPIVSKVSFVIPEYYQKHFELLSSIINLNNCLTYRQVTTYIDEDYSFFLSDLWRHFKRVYLFTDIQIWTSV
jgi:hypothetical protein